MLDSQYKTVDALGEPFRGSSQQPYDFSQQTVTDRVRAEIPTIVRLRLTPPPVETYSLNRKLSGMFLLCNRLGSRINCHTILENILRRHPPDSPRTS
jgi:aarF domain-containing kinase